MIRILRIAGLAIGVAGAALLLKRRWVEFERELRRGM